jgi:hypothetical protein
MVFLPRTSVITPPGHSQMSGTCPRMPVGLAPNAGSLKFRPAAPRRGSERDEGLMPAEPMRTESPRTAAGAEARSAGGLIKPLIVYALLSAIAALRRPQPESGRGDSEQEHVRRDGSRPATGTFGTPRSSDESRKLAGRPTRLLSWLGFVAAPGRQDAVRVEIAPCVLLRSQAPRRALAVRPRERSMRWTPSRRNAQARTISLK